MVGTNDKIVSISDFSSVCGRLLRFAPSDEDSVFVAESDLTRHCET